MKNTIEDIKRQMLSTRDKSGLSVISMIESLVKKEDATIGQAITHLLKDKKISGYKRNILNLLRISYPYDGELELTKNKNTNFVSSLEILKREFESAPNIIPDEVQTALEDRITHPEDNQNKGIGVPQTAVFSVYSDSPDVIPNKPVRSSARKIQKQEKKKEDSQKIENQSENETDKNE